MQREPRSQTRFRVAIPRVNPGSVEPVQPPRLAGVWTVADTHTGMAWHGMVWYGLELNDSSSAGERSSSSWGRRGGGGGGAGVRVARPSGGCGGNSLGGVGGAGGGGGGGFHEREREPPLTGTVRYQFKNTGGPAGTGSLPKPKVWICSSNFHVLLGHNRGLNHGVIMRV